MYLNRTEYSIEESNETTIEDLIKEYHQKIYIYCFNILRNSHDAEDAAQEVFLKVQDIERHWSVTKQYPGFAPGTTTINPAVIEGGIPERRSEFNEILCFNLYSKTADFIE